MKSVANVVGAGLPAMAMFARSTAVAFASKLAPTISSWFFAKPSEGHPWTA